MVFLLCVFVWIAIFLLSQNILNLIIVCIAYSIHNMYIPFSFLACTRTWHGITTEKSRPLASDDYLNKCCLQSCMLVHDRLVISPSLPSKLFLRVFHLFVNSDFISSCTYSSCCSYTVCTNLVFGEFYCRSSVQQLCR